MARRRLDAELVRRGLVATRSQAQSAVRDGLVLVSGRSASKPSTLVDTAEPLELVGEPRRFASRDEVDALRKRVRELEREQGKKSTRKRSTAKRSTTAKRATSSPSGEQA